MLYLDLDDTLVSWREGEPRPAEGVTPFLLWALGRFDVRWLTSWAPAGRMPPDLLGDLARLTGVPLSRLEVIQGLDWEGASKVDGIAWLEHVVLERPFVWMEDDTLPESVLEFLDHHGFRHCFRRCDVTREPGALRRVHGELEEVYGCS